MVDTAARFRASSEVASRDIEEGLILVNVDTGSVFKLNRSGAAVWKRLDGNTDVALIVADLECSYGVGTDVLLHDVGALLLDLQQRGLIALVERS